MSGHDSAPHTISVAICTCNGEDYLQEQLASIAGQSRLPDEIVLVDDLSEDSTRAIASEFAAGAAFPVRIEVNSERLGVTGNFEKAIAACSGDIIVLADQDDVWRADKLATFARIFSEQPEAALAFSDAEVVDARLVPLGYGFWESLAFDRVEQRMMEGGDALTVLLRRNVVAGATMAFRSAFRSLCLPIERSWPHDAWIVYLLASVAGVALTDQRLIRYRQHGRNVCGARQQSDSLAEQVAEAQAVTSRQYQAKAEQYQLLAERLALHRGYESTRSQRTIAECMRHLHQRALLTGARFSLPVRCAKVVSEIVNKGYFRYSSGWRSVIKDLAGYGRFR